MHAIRKDSVSLIAVAEHEEGQRLDNYLIKILKGVPKSHIHRIIRAGEVRLNKKTLQTRQPHSGRRYYSHSADTHRRKTKAG